MLSTICSKVYFSGNEYFLSSSKEYPISEQSDDAVIGKVLMCGICGTDVHITRGRLPMAFPTILGHEWCSQVAALGKSVKRDWVGRPLKVGDYITTAVGSCGT